MSSGIGLTISIRSPVPGARNTTLTVDGRAAWVGTSNWEKDYFHASRNVGVVIEGGVLPRRLDQFFLDGWNGPYAKSVDPCATYTAPRIGG